MAMLVMGIIYIYIITYNIYIYIIIYIYIHINPVLKGDIPPRSPKLPSGDHQDAPGFKLESPAGWRLKSGNSRPKTTSCCFQNDCVDL